jgi:nucleoside-diphosphate-sugar epimerase
MGETPTVTDQHFLVTGASGFIAMHLIELLLSRAHRVRGTLRRLDGARVARSAPTAHMNPLR